MESLVARQDNFFSMAFTTNVALWTIAVSIPNEWIVLLSLLLTFTFSLKICDIWRGTIFLSVYIQICLEEEKTDGWETIRDIYYREISTSSKKSILHSFSKLSLPLLNIASCIIFWVLHGIDFYSWQNILLLGIQSIVCLTHSIIWYRNYDNPSVKDKMINNWSMVKQKYLENDVGDL